ncbi:MAG: ribokinase [Bacteroidetes bacterium]|nr:ribokinase [Bacteroidota bacterium]MCL5026263.1 ribokinase [Chloroflexota bacterium]
MARIIVVGSANMDLVVRAPRLPQPGETVLGARFYTAPGGKGANQAVAAARLGAAVCFVGRVGTDAFGDQLGASLREAGVGLEHTLRDPGAPTGVALITVDEIGQNTIVVASGANARLTAADVQSAAEAIREAQVVMAQLEVPEEAVSAAAALAQQHNVPFLLNPAPARPIPAEVIRAAALLTPNEIEAQVLTGVAVSDLSSAETAGRKLLQQGAEAAVITLGSRGALLVTHALVRHFPAWPVQAVDATAAGDAFAGGLGVAFAEGRSLPDAVYYASAVAALSVTRPGAQPSMPSREDVASFLAAVG